MLFYVLQCCCICFCVPLHGLVGHELLIAYAGNVISLLLILRVVSKHRLPKKVFVFSVKEINWKVMKSNFNG